MALRKAVVTPEGTTYVDMTQEEEAVFEQNRWLTIKPSDVKLEARRRILDSFPDWKQANMTARAVELQDIWRQQGTWLPQEQAESEALRAAWAWIKAVRVSSDALEAMSPIPLDYADDKYWPA